MSSGTVKKTYEGRSITVTFEVARCRHAAECVTGLPEVFDPGERPWVRPDGAGAERVAEVVRRCPSGALQYELKDGGAAAPDRPTP
ncbi:(4Fe-4S)-binding protein [Streptomyces sp. MAR4 CNX-425]|uniref:(4Fe-4S)-binding protein n=1 Tax=Streptomyces sp. MAR4 CNX-425 TaxID=3406343 RepID=UPI003B50BEC6